MKLRAVELVEATGRPVAEAVHAIGVTGITILGGGKSTEAWKLIRSSG